MPDPNEMVLEYDENEGDLSADMALEPQASPGGVESPEAALAALEPTSPPAGRRAVQQSLLFDEGEMVEDPTQAMGIMGERVVPLLEKPWMKHHTFHLVRTVEEMESLIDRAIASGKCALDLEAEGLDTRIYPDPTMPYGIRTRHSVVGFCIAYGNAKEGYYIPIRHRPDDGGPDLNVPQEAAYRAITRLCKAAQPVASEGEKDLLGFRKHAQPPQVVIDFWNASYDQEMLYPITGIDWWHPDSFEDGNLARFVIYSDDKNLGLKAKAKELLRDADGNPYEMIEFAQLFARGRDRRFDSLSPDEPSLKQYACSDAICTRLLGDHPDCVPMAKSAKFIFAYRVEKQVVQVKRVMERNRVKVDRESIREVLTQAEATREEFRQKIIALAKSRGFPDFEPNSPAQLGPFLFDAHGLDISPKPERNAASQQYKTDATTLEELVNTMGEDAPPVLQWILEYRSQEKLIGTYLQSMVDNGDAQGEFRFQFKQTGAATGRFSAPSGDAEQGFGGIPIHGIPATSNLRKAFQARPGYLMVKCDYAGEELRIVTNLSGEKVWINEFKNGDGDLHTITARAFFPGHDNEPKDKKKEQRKAGKVANFALVYGGGPAAVQRAVGCDRVEAKRKKEAFDKAVPTFAMWVKKQHERVKVERGVYTAFGRWIAIPDAAVQEGDYQAFDVNRKYRLDKERAQAVRAACERHATNYPIQGTGADIMKIAMILVHKECWRRGWLKDGKDQVRMLLTVHDELVFEIAPAVLLEALDVITEAMEMPWRMVDRRYSPPWQIPLVTDPLVGLSWGAETSARRAKTQDGVVVETPDAGKGEILAGKFIFVQPPDWLKTILTDGTAQVADPPVASPAAKEPLPESEAAPAPAVEGPATPEPSVALDLPLTSTGKVVAGTQVLTVRLKELARRAIPFLAGVCKSCWDDNGMLLRVVGPWGDVVVPPEMGIRVHPQRLDWELSKSGWVVGSSVVDTL